MPAMVRRSATSFGVASVSTNSRSQPNRIFTDRRLASELGEKPEIALEEEPDVVYPELEHRDSLDAHAERPPRHRLGVVADVAEHLRVHHAAAENLEPPRLLTHAAAAPLAEEAEHVHLRRRLGEGEERWAEADPAGRPEQL